jgi:hypothetical protein
MNSSTQQAAAVQTEKQKLQQQLLSPLTRSSQPVSQPASPLTRCTPTADTPETVSLPATPEPALQKDSQQTEIGTLDETNWEDSQNTQIQSQVDPGTPNDLFSLVDEQEIRAFINGPHEKR